MILCAWCEPFVSQRNWISKLRKSLSKLFMRIENGFPSFRKSGLQMNWTRSYLLQFRQKDLSCCLIRVCCIIFQNELFGVDIINGRVTKTTFTTRFKCWIISQRTPITLAEMGCHNGYRKLDNQRFHPKVGWTFHGHEGLWSEVVPNIFRDLKLPLNEKMKYSRIGGHLRPIALVQEEVTDSAVRRLLKLEMTSMTPRFFWSRYHKQEWYKGKTLHEELRNRSEEVERSRGEGSSSNWQPPISGGHYAFVWYCQVEIGIIKDAIKDAIMDGDIENSRSAAITFMETKGNELGLTLVEGRSRFLTVFLQSI